MNTWNEHFSEMDSVCTQDLSAEDTLFNWSLDDFSDIVPKPMAGEECSVMEIPQLVH